MRKLGFLTALLALNFLGTSHAEQLTPAQSPSSPPANLGYDAHLSLASSGNEIWVDSVGNGYAKGAWEAEGVAGAGFGIRDGSLSKHDLALAELRVGRIMSKVMGEGCWYQGNIGLFGEVIGGAQFHPHTRYVIGAAPVFRYAFSTGTRFVPFVDLSAGAAATSIGHPDLGETFNFILQGGPGLKYYFQDNAAFIVQYRYLHMSDAGITSVNKGINVNMFFLGVSWGF